jgi:alpha-L-arabinofuranosidase
VNPEATPQALSFQLKGVSAFKSKTTVTTLSAKPDDANSIDQPKNVVPVVTTLNGIAPSFTYTLPPTSVVVLTLQPR